MASGKVLSSSSDAAAAARKLRVAEGSIMIWGCVCDRILQWPTVLLDSCCVLTWRRGAALPGLWGGALLIVPGDMDVLSKGN